MQEDNITMEHNSKNHLFHEEAELVTDKNINDFPCGADECRPEEVRKMLFELQVHQIELEMQNEELRQTQLELDETKKRYYDLYNMAPVGYCTLSEKGLIIEANTTATNMFGLSRTSLINQWISSFITQDDQNIYYEFRKKFFETGEKRSCELRMISDNGTIFWAHLSVTAGKGTDYEPILRLVITDVSEQKRMENALRSSDKMMLVQSRQAAMGEMISMIAHQWRQPLNVIGLAIANIETKQMFEILDKATIDENTAVINKNIAFMSDTIDDFRNFFRPEQSKELVTMENIVNSISRIIGQSLENNGITLSILNSSQRGILIHKSPLIQVLLNILNNAKDAFIDSKISPANINITIHETKDSVVITISDNAGGIPKSDIDKIAQPYFTTKGQSGTGLGLYICKTIIEKHLCGTISWQNKNNGASFVISIDLNNKPNKDYAKERKFIQKSLF